MVGNKLINNFNSFRFNENGKINRRELHQNLVCVLEIAEIIFPFRKMCGFFRGEISMYTSMSLYTVKKI